MGRAYDQLLVQLSTRGYKVKTSGQSHARAQCPGHGGEDLNLSIAVGDQGVLVKCMSHGCPAEDIASGVGLTLGQLFDNEREAVYSYGGGHTVHRTRTRDGKKIWQVSKPTITQLYRHPDSVPIEQAESVVIVEGEKCVDAALRLGAECVTTWPGGSSAVDQVNIDPLGGKKITIIADNDDPGRRAAAQMAMRLQGLATVVGIWTARSVGQGVDDIWLAGGSLKDDLVALDITGYISPEDRGYVVEMLDGRHSRAMQWLWRGVLPLGAASVFAGLGGVSKTVFSLWLAGRVTRGLLDGQMQGEPATVLFAGHEDDIDTVVIPRAQVNDVDLSRFGTFGMPTTVGGSVMMPTFPDDLDKLERAIIEHNAKLVIVDPVLSTMDAEKNMNDARHVREVIDPLNRLAQKLQISIVCIAHLNKGVSSARQGVTGSGAWVDATRSTMVFAMEDPEDGEDYTSVIMSGSKANYSKTGSSFTYRVVSVDHLHDSGEIASIPKIQWLGVSTRSVDDLIHEASDTARLGPLSQQLKAFIENQPGAVGLQRILQEFSDEKPATVRSTLSRLAGKGRVHSPAYGIYQAANLRPTSEQ